MSKSVATEAGPPEQTQVWGRRHALRSRLAVAAVAVSALLAAGCSYTEEVCSEGEYPVKSKQGPGSACAKEGKPLPRGYTTYGPGATPTVP